VHSAVAFFYAHFGDKSRASAKVKMRSGEIRISDLTAVLVQEAELTPPRWSHTVTCSKEFQEAGSDFRLTEKLNQPRKS